jgi:aminoglycoside phosphotransferase (APT) family kinase protein
VAVTVGWFEDALRPNSVQLALTSGIPEIADGTLELLRCRINRVRSLPEQDAWTAIYELDVREAVSGRERTYIARGTLTPPGSALPRTVQTAAFGSEGWASILPALRLHLGAVATDTALPGLDVITDPERGAALLQDTLRANGCLHEGTRILRSIPTVVTHKSGIRATVLCRLEYAGGASAGPGAVVVKVHHDDQGAHAHDTMRALHESSASHAVQLAQALAYVPDLRISIQEYVEHRGSLKDLFHRAFDSDIRDWSKLVDATRAAAAGLAGVHRSGFTSGQAVTWDDELATMRSKHHRLVTAVPAVLGHTGSVPDRLRAAAATTSADPLGPAHHSFRAAQVLLTGRGVAIIDFDKFCLAEPASDIALFTAKLQHMGMNKAGSRLAARNRELRVAALKAAFVDEYRRHAPVTPERVHLWEALELSSLVLSAAKKANRSWVETCSRMLETHLQACGW